MSAVRAEASSKGVKKVVLAYSGGLDTSVILKWLQDTYNCEVVTFTADLGQVSFTGQQRQLHAAAWSYPGNTASQVQPTYCSCMPWCTSTSNCAAAAAVWV